MGYALSLTSSSVSIPYISNASCVIETLTAVSLALSLAISRQVQSRPVPDSSSTPLLITDLPHLLPLQEQNVALNNLSPSFILSAALPWGAPLPDCFPEVYRYPEVILAADCVYFEPAFPLLLETLGDLLKPRSHDNGTVTGGVCYFCMKKRRKADMRFVTALRKRFVVKDIDVRSLLQEEGVRGGIYL